MESLKRQSEFAFNEEAEAADIKRKCLIPVPAVADVTLDGLPDLALCHIAYHTEEVKQKLRLALTCRRLYDVVRHYKGAWPKRVYINHGCVQVDDRSHLLEAGGSYHQVLVTVGSSAGQSQRLPATDLDRLLSVMHLPAVCAAPVDLRIVPVTREGEQQYFLTEYVLPWLEQRNAEHNLLFATASLRLSQVEVEHYSGLLRLLCDSAVPVGLWLYYREEPCLIEADSDDSDGRDVMIVLPEAHNGHLSTDYLKTAPPFNVHRLWLSAAVLQHAQLDYLLRRFPNATEVHVGRFVQLGKNWPIVWRSFVESRAEPTRAHSLCMGIGGKPVVANRLARAVARLPSGKSAFDNSERQLLVDVLPSLLGSIEEHAEVTAVTLYAVKPAGKSKTPPARPVWTDVWQWRTLIRLHLRIKHYPAAEWLVDVQVVGKK